MSTHTHIQFESSATVANDELDLSSPDILAAYADVNDKNSETNWFLVTYQKGSNKLSLVGSGSGGIDELREELNSAKAMYGLFKFKLNEERTKTVYLTWVPDGVPTVVKGVVNTHATVVGKKWKGFHVQVNARTEEDLDNDVLLKKIEASAGARY